VLSQLNQGLAGTGITASVDATNGRVQFTGADAFTVGVGAASAGNATATNASTAVNTAQYNLSPAGQVYTAGTNEQFTVSDGTNTVNLTLAGAGDTTAAAVAADINAQLRGAGTPITGVTALVNGDGASVSFQSASNFTVTETLASTDSTGVFVGGAGNQAVTAATTGGTAGTDAEAAIAAINAAVTNLGLVQGSVGSGENTLNYAISLAQSQVTNYTAAESQIKDADVAAEAANLTKAQVLQQASIAAMAQANSSPEAVLKLLQ
jgi:flagellin